MSTTTYRLDVARDALSRPVRRDDGFVVYDARVTRAGVFPYRRADGSTVRELRHPDDVFAPDSLASLRLVPVTLEHPSTGNVNADNARGVSRGASGENIRRDGSHVVAPVAVHDAATAARIDAGNPEVSCGYHCRIEATGGVYEGESYDCRQRDIRYDHVAVGLAPGDARGGSTVSMRLDGAAIQITDGAHVAPAGAQSMTTRKIEMGGASFDVPEAVAARIDALTADATKARAEADAARDALAASAKATEAARQDAAKALTDATAKADAEVNARVVALVALRERAVRVLGDASRIDGKSESEIKRLVIAARTPDVDLTGKADAYLDAAFDFATRGDAVSVMAAAALSASKPADLRADGVKTGTDFINYVEAQRSKARDLWRDASNAA